MESSAGDPSATERAAQRPGRRRATGPPRSTRCSGGGTHFEGKLFFEGRVRIDGGFKGEIRGDDVLVIGEGAMVSGEVHVATCIVTGGEVDAEHPRPRRHRALRPRPGSRAPCTLRPSSSTAASSSRASCKMAPLEEDNLAEGASSDDPGDAPVTPRAGTALP